MKKGLFIIVDGLDGIGKGEIERALIEYEHKLGRAVFDSISFSKAHRKGLPGLVDFWNPPDVYYDTIVTAEPTYCGIGHVIRNEITARNDRKYSAETQMHLFSLDRLVQMKRVVVPALENGLNVIQSRCVASTLTYQLLKAQEEALDEEEIKQRILSHEGNKLQLEYGPDLLIIPTIKDVNELLKRLKEREMYYKDDKSIFEEVAFQEKLKPLYESTWLNALFKEQGTKVAYLNAGISTEETRQQAREIYKDFLERTTKQGS